jgi:hypothetical protein
MASTTLYWLALGAAGFALLDTLGAAAVRAYRRRKIRQERERRARLAAEKAARHQLFWRNLKEISL